ncbi:uncharacterized protein LOC141901464 [Tubulanus polymorphus]|uniref:uncharacterized protein LOC141901464 n=1 Tax=Tubulanus polymorphus TaxID=672921 RepID=UPI003DA61725
MDNSSLSLVGQRNVDYCDGGKISISRINNGRDSIPPAGTPVVRTDEFTIKKSDVEQMENMRERVTKLFQVDVIYGISVQDEGVKRQWVKLNGPSRENNTKAKEYITSICNTCNPIEMLYPPQMLGILQESHDRLEEVSSAIIIFKEAGRLHMYGSDIGITIAMSAIEDILSQYLPDPSVTVKTLENHNNSAKKPVVVPDEQPDNKVLTRQDSASLRLEEQLKRACQLHDLSYEDYKHANNSVKRVLLSWLDHDMDEDCIDRRDRSPVSAAESVTIIDDDQDDSIICLDMPLVTKPVQDCDLSIQEITVNFDRTLASPARKDTNTTASSTVQHFDEIISSMEQSGANSGAIESKNLFQRFGASGASDTVRAFALRKGYTNTEIDVVLKSKTLPYRTSDVIADLYKNRLKSSNISAGEVIGTRIASSSKTEDCPVQNYFQLLSRDFNEETAHFTREEYMKRNRERQKMLSPLFRREHAPESTADSATGAEDVVGVDENVNTRESKNLKTIANTTTTITTATAAVGPTQKKRKKKKKKPKNQNQNNERVLQSASSDSDIQVIASNINKQASPAPHINKKPRQIEPDFKPPPEPMATGAVGSYQTNPTNVSKELFPSLSNRPFKFGEQQPASNTKDTQIQAARPRQRSGNSESDVRQLKNGASIQAIKGQHLRPIVIDGSNVACAHGKNKTFSCHGIKICIDYFLERGHTEITAFVPNWRKGGLYADMPTVNSEILFELENLGYIAFTPSRRIGKKNIVCYDDRFIVELAAENGGVIVSNDNYRDLVDHSNKWRNVIEKRLLMFTFVGDLLMIPQDPLGPYGPLLDDFLTKDEFKKKPNVRVAQPRPPVRPLRPNALTVQLGQQLNVIFPGNNKIISRILDNHPYEEDLNRLTTHVLDVVK